MLLEQRAVILERWRSRIFRAYPPEAARFFRAEKDAFRNPVGHALLHGTQVIYDAVASGDRAPVAEALEAMVRVRAVQELSASEAVAFVFSLKRAVRECLCADGAEAALWAELAGLDEALDGLASAAFDLYSQCRERIYRIRADELRRAAASLTRQFERCERGGEAVRPSEPDGGAKGVSEP
jgi:hypothetical protein